MRSIILLAAIAVAACSASSPVAPAPARETGSISFKIDPISCRYQSALVTTFLVANDSIGAEPLAPGQTSSAYVVATGWPVVQARISGFTSDYFRSPVTLWTLRSNVHVSPNGSVVHVFTC